MATRRLPLLLALALLAVPATAQAADVTLPTLSYPAGGTTTITVFAPNDTTKAEKITIDADHFCFLGCSPLVFDATSGSGWNDATNAKCTQDGGDPRVYHCASNPPALAVVGGTPNNDTITSNCAFLFSTYAVPLQVTAGSGNDSVTGSCGTTDTIDGGPGNDTLAGNLAGADMITGGDGNDVISGGLADSTLSGGAGRDTISGSAGNETIDGAAGGDRIDAGDGNDTITAGADGDYVIPGAGKDTVSGGDGRDTVSYEDRDGSAPVRIALDGQPGSGVADEGDTLNPDIESVVGSPGDDTVTATALANQVDTGDGNDAIDPGAGPDVVDSGANDDTVNARDGFQDTIDCGPGTDTAVVDAFDTVANCETVDSSRELQSDVDNDGVPAPADCNDHDASTRPGVPDKPGDRVDQNCDGHDQPYPRVTSTVQWFFIFNSKSKTTKITSLKVADVPASTTIELRCMGKKCFKGVKKVKSRKAAASVSAVKPIKKEKFHPGQTLEVRVVVPNQIAKVLDFKMKRNGLPSSKLLCLTPGAKKPRKC